VLTLFSIPKPFVGPVADAQKNALDSWVRLGAQVILFGDEEGIGEAAKAAGAEHVATVARNEFGTPLLDDVFQKARERARHERMLYVNADIVLFDDFPAVIERIRLNDFLAVGRRTDLDVPGRLTGDWQRELRKRAAREGRLHEPTGIDYFLFPKHSTPKLPPFPVGRVLWDNWMIHDARSRSVPVIDLTRAVTIVHQNHDYRHVAGGADTVWRGIEAQRNWALVGADFLPLTIADATWVLDDSGLHPANDAMHLFRRALIYPALSPRLKWSVRIARNLYQRITKR
jgi:hypothetical protein